MISRAQPVQGGRRKKGVIFRTDAVAAVWNMPCDVNAWDVDVFSLSGISLDAPKRVGAPFSRDNLGLMPLIHCGIEHGQ